MSALVGILPHAALVAGAWLAFGPRWAGAVLIALGVAAVVRVARGKAGGA